MDSVVRTHQGAVRGRMVDGVHSFPFVFDTLGCDTEALWGTNPPQQLADRMHAAWVAFASTGDPEWPAYEGSRRVTMRFDAVSACVDDPRSLERALWQGVR